MKIKILIVIVLMLITVCTQAQVTQRWVQRYNGSGNLSDQGKKVLVDKTTGDVYVTGEAYGSASGNDIVTIKYNSLGILQWVSTYNGTGNSDDYASDMVLDNLGNIIVTGSTSSSSSGLDYITIKYNTSGTRLWTKKYNGTANQTDHATSIAVDGLSGSIIITGFSNGFFAGSITSDIVTIRYSYFGNAEWVQRYNGSENSLDFGNSITNDDSGNFYVLGSSYNGSTYDFITIKYSPAGNTQWIREVTKKGHDTPIKILTNHVSGEVIIVGNNEDTYPSNFNMVSYDFAGNLKWAHYDIPSTKVTSAAIDNRGYIAVCGNTRVNNSNDDYFLAVYSSDGILTSYQSYDGPGAGNDAANAIAIDKDNNIYVTGYSKGLGTRVDYLTIKYGPAGGPMQWLQTYNFTSSGYNSCSSVAVDNYGNVFITGFSQNNSPTYDIATIKYSQRVAISNTKNTIPLEFNLHQNYPNPFNPSTNIRFDIPEDADVKIVVYDILGKEVQILADEFKWAGSYEINFDANSFSSGTYFYSLEAGDFKSIKKMVLVK
jgi:hypothetical protein